MAPDVTPPLPPGFVLDQANSAPPLPDGFVMDSPQDGTPPTPGMFDSLKSQNILPTMIKSVGQGMHDIGLVGRYGLQGAQSLATLPSTLTTSALNLGTAGYNYLNDKNVPYSDFYPSDIFSKQLDAVGVPKPQTGEERLLGDVVEPVASVLTGSAAGKLAQTGSDMFAKKIGGILAKNVGIQAQAAGAGGLAAGETREQGFGPGLQMTSALLAGMTTPLALQIGKKVPALLDPLYQSGREKIVGSTLNRLATDPTAAQQELQNIPQFVPGSNPTLGPSSKDYGLLQTERGMRNSQPADFANITSQNNEARHQVIDDIAKTPADLKAAKIARQQEAQQLYGDAYKANPSMQSPEIDRILSTPAGKKALKKSVEYMQNDRSLVGVPDAELAEQAKLAGQYKPGGIAKGLKLRTHDYIKQALDGQIDDAISALPMGKTSSKEVEILRNLKNSYLSELDKLDSTAQPGVPNSGKYFEARDAYAGKSKPIKQMETAQDVQNRLVTAPVDPQTGRRMLSQAQWFRQVESDPDLARTFNPQQMQNLEGITNDLNRDSALQTVKPAGSDTTQTLTTQNLIANTLGSKYANIPALTNLLRPVNWLYKTPEDTMRRMMTDALINPKEGLRLMQKGALPVNDPIIQRLLSGAGAAGYGSALGGINSSGQ